MMMKILVLEDERLAAKSLISKLQEVAPDHEVLEVLATVHEAKKWLQQSLPPDLILADIQLADGMSFEIFEQIHLVSPIIFTTAFDEFAIRAFKLNSIDYLLKPIDSLELKRAIDKYRSLQQPATWAETIKNLMGQMASPAQTPRYKERFLALSKNKLLPLHINEIAYFRKDSIIYIHTHDDQKLISEMDTLEELENMLDPAIFFRANRQFLVHINAIGAIQQSPKGLQVQLKPALPEAMEISREKAAAFKRWIIA